MSHELSLNKITIYNLLQDTVNRLIPVILHLIHSKNQSKKGSYIVTTVAFTPSSRFTTLNFSHIKIATTTND